MALVSTTGAGAFPPPRPYRFEDPDALDDDDYDENDPLGELTPTVYNGGRVYSHGIGRGITKQHMVVAQATLHKDEHLIREREAVGLDEDRDLWAPPANNPTAFLARKGMIGFLVQEPGRTTRGAPGSDAGANVRCVVNMAGLPKRKRLFLPIVNQLSRDADRPHTEDRTTVALCGTHTIVHTGMQPQVTVGQLIIVDPQPAMVIENGRKRPLIKIKGCPDDFFPPQTRAMDTSDVHALATKHQHALLKTVSRPEVRRVLAQASYGDLFRQLRKLVDDSCDADYWSEHIPLRAYLRAWLPWHLLKLTRTGGLTQSADHRLKLRFRLLRLVHRALTEAATLFDKAAAGYGGQLPHSADKANPTAGVASVFASALNDRLDPAKFSALPSRAEQMESIDIAECHVDLFFFDHAVVCLHDTYHWLRSFTLGVALSSSTKGNPLDVLTGYGRV